MTTDFRMSHVDQFTPVVEPGDTIKVLTDVYHADNCVWDSEDWRARIVRLGQDRFKVLSTTPYQHIRGRHTFWVRCMSALTGTVHSFLMWEVERI